MNDELPSIFAATPQVDQAEKPDGYVGVWPPKPMEPTIEPCTVQAKALMALTTRMLSPFRGKVVLNLDTQSIVMSGRVGVPRILIVIVYMSLVFLGVPSLMFPGVVVMSVLSYLPIIPWTSSMSWESITRIRVDPKPTRLGVDYDVRGLLGFTSKYILACEFDIADRDRLIEAANVLIPSRVAPARFASLAMVVLTWISIVAFGVAALAFLYFYLYHVYKVAL